MRCPFNESIRFTKSNLTNPSVNELVCSSPRWLGSLGHHGGHVWLTFKLVSHNTRYQADRYTNFVFISVSWYSQSTNFIHNLSVALKCLVIMQIIMATFFDRQRCIMFYDLITMSQSLVLDSFLTNNYNSALKISILRCIFFSNIHYELQYSYSCHVWNLLYTLVKWL